MKYASPFHVAIGFLMITSYLLVHYSQTEDYHNNNRLQFNCSYFTNRDTIRTIIVIEWIFETIVAI